HRPNCEMLSLLLFSMNINRQETLSVLFSLSFHSLCQLHLLVQLPDDLWCVVLRFGSVDDLLMWAQTCKAFNRVILSDKFAQAWKEISFRDLPFAAIHLRLPKELPQTAVEWRDYCFKYLQEHSHLKCRKNFTQFFRKLKSLLNQKILSLDDAEA